jgi:hypothetical protein
VTVTPAVGVGGDVATIEVASTVCRSPAAQTPIAAPVLRSLHLAAERRRRVGPHGRSLTDIASDGHAPARPSIVLFIVTSVSVLELVLALALALALVSGSVSALSRAWRRPR